MSDTTPSEFENHVKALAGLDDQDIAALTTAEIITEDDLSWLELEDLPDTISIVKRRKIKMISKCMSLEDSSRLLQNTSLNDTRKAVRETSKQVSAASATASSQSSNNNNNNNNNNNAVARNAPKITTNPLPKFSGKP